jgi:hypothetical protein
MRQARERVLKLWVDWQQVAHVSFLFEWCWDCRLTRGDGDRELADALCLFGLEGTVMPKMEEGRVTETPVEARAGFLDRPVSWVLVASVALVVVAFAIIYGGFFGKA